MRLTAKHCPCFILVAATLPSSGLEPRAHTITHYTSPRAVAWPWAHSQRHASPHTAPHGCGASAEPVAALSLYWKCDHAATCTAERQQGQFHQFSLNLMHCSLHRLHMSLIPNSILLLTWGEVRARTLTWGEVRARTLGHCPLSGRVGVGRGSVHIGVPHRSGGDP